MTEMTATAPCSICGETLTNRGGFAWFRPNGLMLCASASRAEAVPR